MMATSKVHFRSARFQNYERAVRSKNATHWECSYPVRNMFYIITLGLIAYKIITWSRTKECIVTKLSSQDTSTKVFEICAGLALEKKYGGDFSVYVEEKEKSAEKAVQELAASFPNLHPKIMYQTNTSYSKREHFQAGKEVSRNQTADIVNCAVLSEDYSYKGYILHEYRKELQQLLEFSETVKEQGEKLAKETEREPSSTLCIHLGHITDSESNPHYMEDIESAAVEISKQKEYANWFIFADNALLSHAFQLSIPADSFWKAHTQVADFTQVLDLYVASRICGSVLLTGSESKHGWLIGFLVSTQHSVYYMHYEEFDKGGDQIFLPTWIRHTVPKKIPNEEKKQ